jgi:hypothetical protein
VPLTVRGRTRTGSQAERLYAVTVGVLLVSFVVVSIGRALLGRGTLTDVDVLTAYFPFRGFSSQTLGDAIHCRVDTVDAVLPAMAAIKASLLQGDLPTWSHESGGAPLASLPNHASLSPLTIPFYLLPLWLAPAFVKLGEFAVGISGMVALLRRHGVSRSSSVVAGIVFVSSGFMMMWSNWPQTRVAAFIPALFWAIERLVQERRSRDVVILAVIVCSMLLGGFPAVTLYSLTLAGAYALARTAHLFRGEMRAGLVVLARAGVGVLLGAGLAGVQLIPFMRNLSALGLEERDFAGWHLPVQLFLTTIAPESFGLCVNGEMYGPTNPIEGVGFVGAAAVVVALVPVLLGPSRLQRDGRWLALFLGASAAILILVIWVGGPVLDLLQQLPFYSSNSITRAQSVFGFVMAALAGVGLDTLRRRDSAVGRPTRRAYRITAIALTLLVVSGFLLWVLIEARRHAQTNGYYAHLLEASVFPELLLALAVGTVIASVIGPRRFRAIGPALLAILVVVQSATFASTMLPLSDRENFYPLTPTHAFLKKNLGHSRFGAGDNTMYPATADYYGLRSALGHEFTDPRWGELLRTVDPDVFRSKTFTWFSPSVSPPQAGASKILDQLGVKYWVAAPLNVVGSSVWGGEGGRGSQEVSLAPGERATCRVEAGAIRGIELDFTRPSQFAAEDRAAVHVAVHTPNGVLTGERLLEGVLPRGKHRVGIPGEGLSEGIPISVDIWTSGTDTAVYLRGNAGGLMCTVVQPVDDRLRLVFAERGSSIYQRTKALPRIRWAAHSEVVADSAERLERLRRGLPRDTVLLEDPNLAVAGGEPARVDLIADGREYIAARIRSDGLGYLVVADALVRPGWTALVDGEPSPLVHGNHAFAAVAVPPGDHTVELVYRAPGLRLGAAVTVASIVFSASLLAYPAWARRKRKTAHGSGTVRDGSVSPRRERGS